MKQVPTYDFYLPQKNRQHFQSSSLTCTIGATKDGLGGEGKYPTG